MFSLCISARLVRRFASPHCSLCVREVTSPGTLVGEDGRTSHTRSTSPKISLRLAYSAGTGYGCVGTQWVFPEVMCVVLDSSVLTCWILASCHTQYPLLRSRALRHHHSRKGDCSLCQRETVLHFQSYRASDEDSLGAQVFFHCHHRKGDYPRLVITH